MEKKVTKGLRVWFIIHFVIDIAFAIPLFVAPSWVLGFFGIEVSVVLARLVGAALIGIGGVSFLSYKRSVESYKTMLELKLLWSAAAMIGFVWSFFEGASENVWILFGLFLVFFLVWLYWYRKLTKKELKNEI